MVHPIYKARQSSAYDFAIIELAVANDKPGIATVRLMGDVLAPHARVVEHRIGSNGSENDASRVVDSVLCSVSTPNICVAATDASARCTEPAGDRTKTYSLFHRVGSFVLFVGFSMPTNCASHRPYSQVAAILNFINVVVDAPPWGATTAENGITTPMPPLVNRPFVVGLRLTKSGQNFCGGSLIAPRFVLTAAHCVTDGLAAWVSVASSASSGLENAEPIPIDTKRTRVHPLYQTPFAYSHDAAILELAVPAYAPSIVLERTPDFSDGTAATMYGYGADSGTSGVLSPVMRARSLELLSQETCVHTLPNIDDGVVCALARSGLDACAGDSGSPLVVTDPASGAERLVGIVSAGYGCGLAGVPGLYTRVASIATFVDAYAVSPVWTGVGGKGREGGEAPSRAPSSRPASPPPIPMAAGGGNTPPSRDEANDSGKQSQASEGESQLPLRDGSAAPCVSGPPPSSLPLSSDSFTTGFQSQILKTALPGGLVTAVTKAKLLAFLLGDNPSTYVAPALLTALASPANAVTLFSSGDARRILLVLVTHDATPLNQRRDRFGKATPSSITSASDQQATRCTATASPAIASSEADRSRG